MSKLEDLFYKLKEFNLSSVLSIDEISLFIPKDYKGTDVVKAFETEDDEVLKSTYDYIFRLELVAFSYKGRYEENDIFDTFYFVPSPYRDIVEQAIKIATFDVVGYTKNDDEIWNSIKKCSFYRLEILDKIIYQLEKKLPKCGGKQKLSSYEADVSLLNSLSYYCGIVPNFKVPKLEEREKETYDNVYVDDGDELLDNDTSKISLIGEEGIKKLKDCISRREKKKKKEKEIDKLFERNNTETEKRFLLTLQGFFFEDNEYLTHKFRDSILDIKIFISEEKIKGNKYKLNVDLTSFLLEDVFFNIDSMDIAEEIAVLISDSVAECIQGYLDDEADNSVKEIIYCINERRFSIINNALWKFISKNFKDEEFLTKKKFSHSAVFNESPRMMNVEEVLEKLPHKIAYGIGELE